MQDVTRTPDTPDTPDTADDATAAATRPLSWRRLLRITAVADLVALWAVAAWFSDLEAAAVGVGFGVGLLLLRWRSGLIGKLLLAVLFIDVLAWMVLGAITNIAGGEPLGAVLVPAVLSGISLTGLVATIASFRRHTSAGRGTAVAAGLGAVVVVVAVIAALVTPEQATADADVLLVSEDVLFDRSTIEVPAGELTVALENRDLFWHTFTVDELGVDLAVPVSADRQVTFTAEPGTYTFYCRIPGHETRMAGTLIVR